MYNVCFNALFNMCCAPAMLLLQRFLLSVYTQPSGHNPEGFPSGMLLITGSWTAGRSTSSAHDDHTYGMPIKEQDSFLLHFCRRGPERRAGPFRRSTPRQSTTSARTAAAPRPAAAGTALRPRPPHRHPRSLRDASASVRSPTLD